MANVQREIHLLNIKALLPVLVLVIVMINGGECIKPPNMFSAPRRSLLGSEQPTIFNIMDYGAKGDGRHDDALAIIKAWKAACNSTGLVKMVIPSGSDFMAGEVIMSGPCNAQSPITIEIQGNLSANTDPSLYSRGAWILIEHVDNLIVTGRGTINGHGDKVWEYADGITPLPVSLIFQMVGHAELSNLNFIDSMGFHSKVTNSHDVTVSNLTITAPGKSPNTDGMHLSNATNVNITDSVIGTGDDCVSIGHGCVNILVQRVQCGPGHGIRYIYQLPCLHAHNVITHGIDFYYISVGSLGKREDEENVRGISVLNCTLTGTTNGARIKTYHNSPKTNATSIIYKDIVMNQVKNPIIIDQHYDSKRLKEQSSVKISDVHFINFSGSSISPVAVRLNCSSTYPCEGVELNNINLVPYAETAPLESACANAKISLKGTLQPAGPTDCM